MTCKACNSQAIGIYNSRKLPACGLPFCFNHGVTHDLSSCDKLISLEEEANLVQQTELRTGIEKIFGRLGASRTEIKSTGVYLVCLQKWAPNPLRAKIALTITLLCSFITLILLASFTGSYLRTLQCSEGFSLYPGGECWMLDELSLPAEKIQHYIEGTRPEVSNCKVTEESNSIDFKELLSLITCRCPYYQFYDWKEISCRHRACERSTPKVIRGACETSPWYPERPGFQNKGCPIFTKAVGAECWASTCRSIFYFTTEHGECQLCPPYQRDYSGFGNCQDIIEESTKLYGANDLSLDYFDSGSQFSGRRCPLSDQGEPLAFNDSFGLLQCLNSSTQTYTDGRLCRHHETFNWKRIGCQVSCPPYQRYEYSSRRCMTPSCPPTHSFLLANGSCKQCDVLLEVAGRDGECINRY